MIIDTVLTSEVLTQLGFGEYWCKGAYGRRHLDIGEVYYVNDIDEEPGGSYGGHKVDPSPQHFCTMDFKTNLKTVHDLIIHIAQFLSPEEMAIFLDRVVKIKLA